VRVFWDWPVEVADKITGYEITTVPATVTQTAPPDTAWYDFFYVTFTKSVSYLFYVASVNKNGKSAPVPDYGPIIPNP
jgi:hypothetical protein